MGFSDGGDCRPLADYENAGVLTFVQECSVVLVRVLSLPHSSEIGETSGKSGVNDRLGDDLLDNGLLVPEDYLVRHDFVGFHDLVGCHDKAFFHVQTLF